MISSGSDVRFLQMPSQGGAIAPAEYGMNVNAGLAIRPDGNIADQ